jgi:two-component system, chemotaxis family, response regulator Rcp1
VVEDNPADVGLVREALGEHAVDCELHVIHDGEKAIRFIDQVDAGHACCPDLVLLDLNLPKRPGREVLKHLRASVTCGQVLVAVLTSSNALKDREETARLGATRYIQKPSDLDEFIKLGRLFKEMLDSSRER